MATILKRRQNEASILSSFSISKRNEPAYSRTCKDRSEVNPAYSTPQKDQSELCLLYKLQRAKRSEVCLFHKFEKSQQRELCLFHKLERSKQSQVCLLHKLQRAKSVYSTNCNERSKKTNWIEVKQTEVVFLKLLWSPGIDSKELILKPMPWRARTSTLFQLCSQPPQIVLKFQHRAGIFKHLWGLHCPNSGPQFTLYTTDTTVAFLDRE